LPASSSRSSLVAYEVGEERLERVDQHAERDRGAQLFDHRVGVGNQPGVRDGRVAAVTLLMG